MRLDLTRRRLLAGAAALAAMGMPAGPARAAADLAIVAREIVVNGRPARVLGLRRPDGGSGLVLEPGARFAVSLRNTLPVPSIIHWHGQTPPPDQDGVAEFGVTAIPPGGSASYDFPARPGTHWMHSHHGLQEQALLAAPLIVRTAEDAREDRQDVTVLLHDFTFRDGAEVLTGLLGGGHGAGHGTGHALPGQGGGHGAHGGHGGHAGHGAAVHLHDVEFDAYLANDRTLDDPEVVRTERGGRVRLRLINAATATAFWIDTSGTAAQVLAVDGNPVRPVTGTRFPLANAQRLDLALDVPAGTAVPILAQREGERARTGIILAAPGAAVTRLAPLAAAPVVAANLSLDRRLVPVAPLAQRRADRTLTLRLTGGNNGYDWGLDGRGWDRRASLSVRQGERVVLRMINETDMAHPMHLHGHHFQVVGIDRQSINGPVRDTVLVMPRGQVDIAFDADNPGRWLLHCHNLYHMAAGMMTTLAYEGVA